MNKQPEALRLADELENGECFDVGGSGVAYGWLRNDPTSEAADELRRLHKENERLREALRLINLHAQQGLLTPEYAKSYLLEIRDLTKPQ